MPRYANMSQPMMSGNTGESSQIQIIDTRAGPTPMVLQVSPQNQALRHVDIRQMPAPSDQGMLSVGLKEVVLISNLIDILNLIHQQQILQFNNRVEQHC